MRRGTPGFAHWPPPMRNVERSVLDSTSASIEMYSGKAPPYGKFEGRGAQGLLLLTPLVPLLGP